MAKYETFFSSSTDHHGGGGKTNIWQTQESSSRFVLILDVAVTIAERICVCIGKILRRVPLFLKGRGRKKEGKRDEVDCVLILKLYVLCVYIYIYIRRERVYIVNEREEEDLFDKSFENVYEYNLTK